VPLRSDIAVCEDTAAYFRKAPTARSSALSTGQRKAHACPDDHDNHDSINLVQSNKASRASNAETAVYSLIAVSLAHQQRVAGDMIDTVAPARPSDGPTIQEFMDAQGRCGTGSAMAANGHAPAESMYLLNRAAPQAVERHHRHVGGSQAATLTALQRAAWAAIRRPHPQPASPACSCSPPGAHTRDVACLQAVQTAHTGGAEQQR